MKTIDISKDPRDVKEILDQADTIISLSRLTLTHEMSRLFLIEQLYRALTIIEGHKYHR